MGSTLVECRTCAEPISGTNIISVLAKVTDEKDVLQVIEEVASLEGSMDDSFPKFICRKCYKLLRSTVIFRRMIISSYKEFKEKLIPDQEIKNESNVDLNLPTLKFVVVEEQSDETIEFKIESDYVETETCKNPLSDDEISLAPKAEIYQNNENNNESNISDQLGTCNPEDKTNTEQNYRTKKKYVKLSKPTKKKSQNTKESKNTSRICLTCGKLVNGKQNYKVHMKMHNDEIPPLVYVCPVCPKQFSQKNYLLIHQRTHTGEKPFRCDLCNKNFSQLASYYVHKRRLHDKVVQGTCSYCGKQFVDKPELDVHIRTYHTGERPYLCEVCSATFVCNRTLQRHKKLHSEKSPCQKCGKMLTEYALKRHLVRHQVLEEGLKLTKKKYTCEYCNTVMNFKSRIKHLERQHGIKLCGRGDDCKKIPIISEST